MKISAPRSTRGCGGDSARSMVCPGMAQVNKRYGRQARPLRSGLGRVKEWFSNVEDGVPERANKRVNG